MKIIYCTLALWLGLSCQAGTIEGRVVSVADGDTVTVLDAAKVQHKIRLSGIDAPEKAQAFGNRSKESLSDLVFDKPESAVTITGIRNQLLGRRLSLGSGTLGNPGPAQQGSQRISLRKCHHTIFELQHDKSLEQGS